METETCVCVCEMCVYIYHGVVWVWVGGWVRIVGSGDGMNGGRDYGSWKSKHGCCKMRAGGRREA